jgi:hypothetical protein
MEPLALVFSAIVAGATAALKPTAEKAVIDAYDGLKSLIKNKWGRVELDALERDPTSETRQKLVAEDLLQLEGLEDGEVLEQAKTVLGVVNASDPDAAAAAGITIEDLEAGASANIEDMIAAGALIVRRIKAEENITVKGVRAGNPTMR